MNEAEKNELGDKAMGGRLSAEELAKRPELEEDAALGKALNALPAPPQVSTNFTSLVMEGIRASEREARGGGQWFRWPVLARAAVGLAAMTVIGLVVVERRENLEIADGARTMATVTSVATQKVPAKDVVEVFQDFDAIRNLPAAAPAVDYALLAALDSK